MANVKIVKNVAELYKKLSPEKQVYVLGIMQGMVISRPEEERDKPGAIFKCH